MMKDYFWDAECLLLAQSCLGWPPSNSPWSFVVHPRNFSKAPPYPIRLASMTAFI